MPIFDSRSSEALRALCRAYRYRKHSVIVENHDSHELIGGYWDGGSRSAYTLYNPKSGEISAVKYPTDPPAFGGGNPPALQIPRGWYLIIGGTFCGKPATLQILGSEALRIFCGISNISPLIKRGI